MTYDTVDDADALMREAENRFLQQQRDSQRFTEAMRGLTVKASNRNQSVKVKVDANGCLSDLRLDATAMRLRPEQLRDEIMRGIRHAQQKLIEEVDALATSIWGPGTETGAAINSHYVSTFGLGTESEGRRP